MGPCVLTVFLSLWPHSPIRPIFTRPPGPKMEAILQARECTGAPQVRDFGMKIGRLEERKFCTSRFVPPFPTKSPIFPPI